MKQCGKHIIAMMMTIVMMLNLLPVSTMAAAASPAAAAEKTAAAEPTATVSSVSGTPGDIVSVDINLKNTPEMILFMVNMAYSDILTLKSVTFNPALEEKGGMVTTPEPYENPQPISFMSALKALDINGLFATVTFQISESAKEGDTADISLTYDPDNVGNDDGNVPVKTVSGHITVYEGLPGDVNGDGKVNGRDSVLLFRYVAGWKNITVDADALDCSGDGKVNGRDSVLLFRYVAGWPNIKLHRGPVHKHVMKAIPSRPPTCTEDGNIAYWQCTACGKYYNNENGTTEIQLANTVLQATHHAGTMQAVPRVESTCVKNGNTAYWHCTSCGKYFADSQGEQEIQQSDTVLPLAEHSPEIIPRVEPTYDKEGSTEGSRCSVCGKVLKAPEKIPALTMNEYSITYSLTDNDPYLETLLRDGKLINENPATFYGEKGLKLKPLHVNGYTFKGWVNGYGENVREIPAGTDSNVRLYARWEASASYTIHFVSEGAPQEVRVEGKTVTSVTKKINQSLIIPEAEMQGYVFLCWTDAQGNIVKNIEPGSYGQKTLYANWTSVRNQTIPVKKLDKPMVYEDDQNGQILFVYELGKIINVPLQELHFFGNVIGDGLTWTKETSTQVTVNQSRAQQIADSISNTTTMSSSWTLSDEWNKAVTCDEQHQTGATKSQIDEITKRVEDGEQWNVSYSNGGSTAYSKNSGSSSSSSEYETSGKIFSVGMDSGGSSSHTDSGEFSVGVEGKVSNSTTVSASAEIGTLIGPVGVSAGAGVSNTTGFELGGHVDYTKNWTNSNDSYWDVATSGSESSGTEKTKVNESYSNATSSQQSTWNSSNSYANSHNVQNETSTSQALSQMINDTYGYSSSQGHNTENSKTTGKENQKMQEREYSTTVEYSTENSEVVTTTITNEGAAKGWYRLVSAGTVHVFGVVGYDIATNSYYTYSYNVIDDTDRYEFFDFSKDDPKFSDRENGVLPFEIPGEVHDLISDVMLRSDNLVVDEKTGTVTEYTGNSQAVVVPDYVSIDNGSGTRSAVKITGISENVFKGNTNIKAVKLSRFISQIPDNAFSGCTGLEIVVSPGVTQIGENAFSGCTSLNSFRISRHVNKLGNNAFRGVKEVTVFAANVSVVQATMKSGAKNIKLWIDKMSDSFGPQNGENRVLTIPEGTEYVALYGERHTTMEDTEILSYAKKTVINGITLNTNHGVVLNLHSDQVDLAWCNINTDSIAMVLHQPNTEITLRGTSTMKTTSENAVLSRNADYTIIDHAVASYLNVYGNMLVCGEMTEEKPDLVNITNGVQKRISEDEFTAALSSHKMIFNANGGNVSPDHKIVRYGNPYGELPVPTRIGYTFNGWYTAAEGGSQVTAETSCRSFSDFTVYAHWSVNTYTASWNSGTGYSIDVTRTSSPNKGAATGKLNSGDSIYHGDILEVKYNAREGYSIVDHGITSATVTGNLTASNIYASARVNSYTVRWNEGTGYSITVSRTSSPLQGAATGRVSNGSTIYYGDTLSINYEAHNGYSITGSGETGITVTGNVDSSKIHASARPNNYTYNIVYRSVNGTDLGSSSETHEFGSSHRISAPDKHGYATPGAQQVAWDSTNGKTITFIYHPNSVHNPPHSDQVMSSPKIRHSTTVEYRNRTASTVELRAICTSTIGVRSYTNYGQKFTATVNGVSTGEVQIVPFSNWYPQVSYERSETGTSGWITVPLWTTDPTVVTFEFYYYQTNNNNTDMTLHYGAGGLSTSWAINIPAF